MTSSIRPRPAVPVLLLLLAAAIGGEVAAQAPGPAGTLVVANRLGGSVSFFDLELGVEVARLPVGPRIPHEVAVSPDGRRAITGAYGGGDDPGRHLVVIDLVGARETGRIDLGPDSRPHSMAFLPDGRRAVATMELSDRLAMVDVVDLEVLRTYPTGGREGHMVRLSPDGRRAYVTSRGAEGTLSFVFLEEDRGPVVIPTGEGAEGIAVTPDGGEIWVANRDARTISVVDAGTLEVVVTLETPPDPRRVEITSTGRALVPNGAGPGAVAVYDLESRQLLENASVGEGGGFGILAHGSSAFLSDRATGEILVWDPDRPRAVRTLTTGHEEPDGMAWSPRRVAPFD